MRSANSNSADIIVRNNNSRFMVMATVLNGDLAQGPITVSGNMSDFEMGGSTAVSFTLTEDDCNNVDPQQNDTEWKFLDPDGNETGFGIKSYSVTQAIDGNYQIHSGTVVDDQGNESDFVVTTDPLSGTLIVIIVLVVATTLLVFGAEFLCWKAVSEAIAACNQQGGVPKVKAAISGGPKWDSANHHFEMAPHLECQCECLPVPQ